MRFKQKFLFELIFQFDKIFDNPLIIECVKENIIHFRISRFSCKIKRGEILLAKFNGCVFLQGKLMPYTAFVK